MSSILKALQKLESETLEKGSGQSWLHHFTAGKKSLEKKAGIRGQYRFALLWGGLIILGSAAFIFLKSEPAAVAPVSGPKPVPAAGDLVQNNEPAGAEILADKSLGAAGKGKIAVNAGRPSQIGITAEENAPPNRTAGGSVIARGADTSTPADGPVVLKDTKKSANLYPDRSSSRRAAMGKEDASAGPKKTTPLPVPLESSGPRLQPTAVESPDTGDNANRAEGGLNSGGKALEEPPDAILAKRMQNPDIKLHAISWTSDVKTRIAVIDGRIVREGDTISNYQVYRINPDDIVLSQGGEFWRLAFRGR